MSNVRLLFAHALSPLHAGTGQSTGAVDLAIARDQATGFPYLPASSLKGSLRDLSRRSPAPDDKFVFGPDTRNAHEHSGAAVFGDANLLLLPVRSVAGTFAWVTSPYLLARFLRDVTEAGVPWSGGAVPTFGRFSECMTAKETALALTVNGSRRVVFEDLDLAPTNGDATPLAAALGELVFPGDSYWQAQLAARLCVVHDDVMSFVAQHATHVVARVALDEHRKTVRKGGLWYEESLPAETVLVSLLAALPQTSKIAVKPADVLNRVAALAKEPIQLGGKGTVGRGRCRLVVSPARN